MKSIPRTATAGGKFLKGKCLIKVMLRHQRSKKVNFNSIAVILTFNAFSLSGIWASFISRTDSIPSLTQE